MYDLQFMHPMKVHLRSWKLLGSKQRALSLRPSRTRHNINRIPKKRIPLWQGCGVSRSRSRGRSESVVFPGVGVRVGVDKIYRLRPTPGKL